MGSTGFPYDSGIYSASPPGPGSDCSLASASARLSRRGSCRGVGHSRSGGGERRLRRLDAPEQHLEAHEEHREEADEARVEQLGRLRVLPLVRRPTPHAGGRARVVEGLDVARVRRRDEVGLGWQRDHVGHAAQGLEEVRVREVRRLRPALHVDVVAHAHARAAEGEDGVGAREVGAVEDARRLEEREPAERADGLVAVVVVGQSKQKIVRYVRLHRASPPPLPPPSNTHTQTHPPVAR